MREASPGPCSEVSSPLSYIQKVPAHLFALLGPGHHAEGFEAVGGKEIPLFIMAATPFFAYQF
jgi:hypothetical protein